MNDIRPFRIDVADATLRHIRDRVAQFPWHKMPGDGGWDYGTNLDYLRDF